MTLGGTERAKKGERLRTDQAGWARELLQDSFVCCRVWMMATGILFQQSPPVPRCRHVVNASGSNWQMGLLDFTGCEMVLVLKLITVAVARQDYWQSKKKGKVCGGRGERADWSRGLVSRLESWKLHARTTVSP